MGRDISLSLIMFNLFLTGTLMLLKVTIFSITCLVSVVISAWCLADYGQGYIRIPYHVQFISDGNTNAP